MVARDESAIDLVRFAASAGNEAVWLLLALVAGRLPSHDDIRDYARRAALTDPITALLESPGFTRAERARKITVISRDFLLRSPDSGSIRLGESDRVAEHLHVAENVSEVRWSSDMRRWLCGVDTVVPWQSRVTAVGIDSRIETAARMGAIADFSRTLIGAVGYGLDVLFDDPDNAPAFAVSLYSLQRIATICAVNEEVERQLLGWVGMLGVTGLSVPSVIKLEPPSGEDKADWRDYLIALFAVHRRDGISPDSMKL